MEKEINKNKMGTVPIPKLLATMSLPAIFSMLIQSLYNIVDSVFVSRVSETALDAVSIAFPLQMILLAFALGIGVGTNSIVARKLGENKPEEANSFAQTGLFMAIVTSAVFMVLGAFLPKLFMSGFTQNDEVIKMGSGYLTICMVFNFGMMIEMLFSKTLQATGNMLVPMVSQLIGAITNIILDPLFIFTFKMGVNGAGVATVIGQIFAMVFSIIMASRKTHIIQIFFKKFKFKLNHFLTIAKVGAPVMVMNAVGGFIIIILNGILYKYSEKAITVLGVYFKLQSFIFMPVFGLTQGALPILAYNFGACNRKRYFKTFIISCSVALIIMVLGTVIFQLFPVQLLSIFNASEELNAIGKVALRTISWSFIPAALGIVVTTSYQSIGYGFTSLAMSLLRQVALIIPSAVLLGNWWGLDAIWICYPFSEICTVLLFFPYLLFVSRKVFKKKELLLEQNRMEIEIENEMSDIDDKINTMSSEVSQLETEVAEIIDNVSEK